MARCIDDLVKASKGAVSKKEAADIVRRIEAQFNRKMPKQRPQGVEKYRRSPESGKVELTVEKSPEQLMVEAAEDAFKEAVRQKENAARRKEIQIERAHALQYKIQQFTPQTGRNAGHFNQGLTHVLNVLVSGRVKAVTEELMTELYRGFEPFLSMTGFKKLTPEQELEVVRTIMADDGPAKRMPKDETDMTEVEYLAHKYRLASDAAFNRANNAGSAIQYLRGRVPQAWDSREVRYFGLSAKEQLRRFKPGGLTSMENKRLRARAQGNWVDFVQSRIDRSRYLDPETGAQLDDGQIREMLDEVWLTLATGGLAKEPGDLTGGTPSLAKRLEAHREIHFATPEGWLEANRAFGSRDLFQAMIADLRGKAQAIALMEYFGPNAEAGFRTADAYAKSQQAQATLDGTAGSTSNALMFEELMGRTNHAAEESHDLINRVMQGTRNYLTASKMGMLLLSQVNDIATFRAMAQTDGLDTGRAFKVALKMLNPRNAADREIARKQGILASTVINDVALRYGAEQTQSMSRTMANWTVKLSGAEHWTNALKQGYQLLIGSHVHDYRGIEYDALEADFRAMLQRHDIQAADWEVIRRAESVDIGGVSIVSPYAVKRAGHPDMNMEQGKAAAEKDLAAREAVREAASKYGALLAEEADTGMLTPDLRTHAFINEATRPGTLMGETARSLFLFKTFSIAMLTKALPRIFAEGAGHNRYSVAAQWAIGMMVGGALSMQLKDIAKGKNPKDMADWKFWLAALAQSGGLGIFGDFVLSDANRFGQSLAVSLAGPVLGLADDLKKLTVGNLQQAAEGKETHVAAEAIQFGKNYAPLMNLWYTRLALDHLLFFHVQEAANPGYLRRMRQRAEKDRQSFWWAPDDNLPEGPPDLAEAFRVGE